MYSGMMPNMDYLLLQRPVHPRKMLSSGPISGSFFDVFRGFIQSVNTMESTVLVPTLLKDINLEGVSWLPTLMVKCNYRQLFEIYCAIKKCKTSFFQVDIDEAENERSTVNANNNNNDKMAVNENHLLVSAIESGMNYLSADYVIDYCQQLEQQQLTPITTKVPDVPSPSPSSSTLSSSSGSNLSRKQKISLDSGNWSSRESDSIDDDFEFESDKSNGQQQQQQSTTGTLNYPSIDSVIIDPIVVATANNTVVVDDQSQSNQQPSLTTLLRATSSNLRNLKVLCNHLKEVADFVTQQYLEALQLI